MRFFGFFSRQLCLIIKIIIALLLLLSQWWRQVWHILPDPLMRRTAEKWGFVSIMGVRLNHSSTSSDHPKTHFTTPEFQECHSISVTFHSSVSPAQSLEEVCSNRNKHSAIVSLSLPWLWCFVVLSRNVEYLFRTMTEAWTKTNCEWNVPLLSSEELCFLTQKARLSSTRSEVLALWLMKFHSSTLKAHEESEGTKTDKTLNSFSSLIGIWNRNWRVLLCEKRGWTIQKHGSSYWSCERERVRERAWAVHEQIC